MGEKNRRRKLNNAAQGNDANLQKVLWGFLLPKECLQQEFNSEKNGRHQ